MASASLSDEELRARLVDLYKEEAKRLPPIVATTRNLLLRKVTSSDSMNVEEVEVSFSDNSNGIKIVNNAKVAAKKSNQIEFKTIVFLDLEATGLPTNTLPPRITELSMIALDADHFKSLRNPTLLPRVLNTLTLCFNPSSMIPEHVSDLTGLTNSMLEPQSKFSADTASLIKAFLNHLPQPVCLVAHNGLRYDFALLNSELNRVGSDLSEFHYHVIDSLPAMKEIFKSQQDQVLYVPSPEPEVTMEDDSDDELDVSTHREDVEGDQAPSLSVTPTKPVKKPKLLHEQELLLVSNPMQTPEKLFENPIPTTCRRSDHTEVRKMTSNMMSGARRKDAANAKKRLNFDSPPAFSLPKLHEHIFGNLPQRSHRADDDVSTLIRVCASRASAFLNYASDNSIPLSEVRKMW